MGKDDFIFIAGPCAVESEDQIVRIAKQLKELGVDYLRGGVFKPRTSPKSFQGLQEEGLEYLLRAKEETGLPIITELLTIDQVKKYADFVDIIQIGSRNMYNYELLKEVGKTNKKVVLKRGLSATFGEWLGAAEYIKQGGNEDIVLCERGIRGFDNATRNVLDLQAVPYIHNNTEYPIIVDPSHAAGNRYMIEPMSLAATAAGADGLMIEVHDRPDESMCDRSQAIDIEQVSNIYNKVKTLRKVMK